MRGQLAQREIGSPAQFDDALEQLVTHVRSRVQAASAFLAAP